MTLVSSTGSVPAARASVKTAYCVECFTEHTRRALRTFYGRELCAACYRAEEDACYGAQEARHDELDYGLAAMTSDRMDSLGAVLHGMGL